MNHILSLVPSDYWESIAAGPRERVKPRRQEIEKQLLCNWAMLALYTLAAITFPHEASTRYPAHREFVNESPSEAAPLGELGCEHYLQKKNKALGVVVSLPVLVRTAELMLNDISPILESIAGLKTLTNS